MLHGLPQERSSSPLSILASAGRAHLSFWRPTADGTWGPGNGLFELIERRATSKRSWDIDWKPERLSASFHGRDLFAPVAAMLRGASHRPASRARIRYIAGQIGRTI
jgi:hypothetical protein